MWMRTAVVLLALSAAPSCALLDALDALDDRDRGDDGDANEADGAEVDGGEGEGAGEGEGEGEGEGGEGEGEVNTIACTTGGSCASCQAPDAGAGAFVAVVWMAEVARLGVLRGSAFPQAASVTVYDVDGETLSIVRTTPLALPENGNPEMSLMVWNARDRQLAVIVPPNSFEGPLTLITLDATGALLTTSERGPVLQGSGYSLVALAGRNGAIHVGALGASAALLDDTEVPCPGSAFSPPRSDDENIAAEIAGIVELPTGAPALLLTCTDTRTNPVERAVVLVEATGAATPIMAMTELGNDYLQGAFASWRPGRVDVLAYTFVGGVERATLWKLDDAGVGPARSFPRADLVGDGGSGFPFGTGNGEGETWFLVGTSDTSLLFPERDDALVLLSPFTNPPMTVLGEQAAHVEYDDGGAVVVRCIN